MASKSTNRYSPGFRERAVRILLDQRGEYRSEHATIHSLPLKSAAASTPCGRVPLILRRRSSTICGKSDATAVYAQREPRGRTVMP